MSRLHEGSSSQEGEDSTSHAGPDPKDVPMDALDENVLVNFMLLNYHIKELITKVNMLKIVIKKYKNQPWTGSSVG